jgi:hypothetical protein
MGVAGVSKAKPPKPKKPKPVTVYVVERAAGYGTARPDADVPDPEDDEFDPDDFDQASHVPVAVFADRAAAEAEADRLNVQVRAEVYPIRYAAFAWDGAKTGKAVAAGLTAMGLTPPKFGKNEYAQWGEFQKWWDATAKDPTAEQRAAIWGLLPGVTVYRVVERPMEE